MNIQIIFVTYIPRSGSTFLLNELDKYSEILSLTENNYINVILNKKKIKRKDLKYYFDKSDHNTAWEFSELEKEKLSKETDIYSFFLNSLLIQHRKIKPEASVIIYKNSGLNEFLYEMPQKYIIRFNIKFIVLIRDLRAIYFSHSNMRSEKNGNFNSNPLIIVNYASALINYVEILKKKKNVLEIKYEELIVNFDETVREILKFINKDKKFVKQNHDFIFRVGEESKTIHQNIKEKPMISNIAKWKGNIAKISLLLLEQEGVNFFNSFSYEKELKKPSIACVMQEKFYNLYFKCRIFFRMDKY